MDQRKTAPEEQLSQKQFQNKPLKEMNRAMPGTLKDAKSRYEEELEKQNMANEGPQQEPNRQTQTGPQPDRDSSQTHRDDVRGKNDRPRRPDPRSGQDLERGSRKNGI